MGVVVGLVMLPVYVVLWVEEAEVAFEVEPDSDSDLLDELGRPASAVEEETGVLEGV